MDDEIKTGEMTGEIDESITVEEDFTALEGKAVSISDDSDNKTNEEEVYEEALDIKESLDDIRQQIKDKLLNILEKGKITDADGCEIELLNDQYTEKYNELKDLANTVLPGGKGASSTTDTTEIVKVNIDYDEILKTISEKADWLYIDEDGQVMLNGEVVPKLKVVELEAEKIKADVGEFKTLTTENFTATNAQIENLKANKADIEYLNANYATIQNLNATNANITNLQATKANIIDLNAANANIANLQAIKADITDLNAAKADINVLHSDVADITTLVNGNLTSDNIQSMVITGDKFTVANGFIKNAMIDSVNASKINAGIINTNNVSIQSDDGSMLLQGNLQQFKDKNGKVRIQIGKDAKGNFTFCLYDENGTGQLINEKGIQSSNAIADGLIVDAKVADNANISGGKIDMSSLFTTMNNSGYTLKSSKIKFDDKNQTLDVAFNNMTNTVKGNTDTLNTHTTSINAMDGKVTQLISDTTITKQDGTTTSLKDAYNATVDTVNSHTQTIGSLETNLSKVSTGQNKWLLEMYEKGEGIDDISPITINDIMGKALIKAVLVDDSVTSNQSQFDNQYLGRATTHVYLEADYNWETTATSDDGSTIYINGAAIATLTSCAPTTVTIPFKQGWNKITWVYNEGIGGDGWDFNPRLSSIPQIKYMNAYPMTNVDEVGNILDGNIKTVSSKQATLEQNLDGFKQTVSNTYTTKAEFDNLEIGGRNFVKNSNFAKGSAYWPLNWATSISDTILHNGHKSLRISASGQENFGWFGCSQTVLRNIQPNTTITVSCWYYVEDKSTFDDSFGLELKGEKVEGGGHEVFIGVGTYSSQMENGVWKRIVATSATDCHWNSLYIYPWVAKNGTVYVTDIKVELGNKATDWSPAPEDIDDSIAVVDNKFVNYSTTSQMNSAINQKANEITSTVSETYATKATVTDVSNNLKNNYSTTSAMNSAIKQKADSILSTVSSTYATTQSTSSLLKESITEYYLSTSNTTLSGGAWGTTSYTPTPGKYIWQRTKSVTNAGDIKYSNPICVSDEMYTVILKNEVLLLKCNSDGEVI